MNEQWLLCCASASNLVLNVHLYGSYKNGSFNSNSTIGKTRHMAILLCWFTFQIIFPLILNFLLYVEADNSSDIFPKEPGTMREKVEMVKNRNGATQSIPYYPMRPSIKPIDRLGVGDLKSIASHLSYLRFRYFQSCSYLEINKG